MATNYSFHNANVNSADYRIAQKRTLLSTEQRIKLMQKWLEEHKDFAWCDSYKSYKAELDALLAQ